MVISSVPMGIPSAEITTIFLRNAICRKFLAAYRTDSLPLHIYVYVQLVAAAPHALGIRKKDSIHLRCLNGFSIIGRTYPFIVIRNRLMAPESKELTI